MLFLGSVAISIPSTYVLTNENDTQTVREYILEIATINNINANDFWLVAWGESKLNLNAIGDSGKSYGLWQIYLPQHFIGRECALDLICSTDYAVKLWKQDPRNWTCYRELKKIQNTNNCKFYDKIK